MLGAATRLERRAALAARARSLEIAARNTRIVGRRRRIVGLAVSQALGIVRARRRHRLRECLVRLRVGDRLRA